MKFYVIGDTGFGRDVSAGRTILAFKEESDVTEAAKKYGTELTEQQYRDIFYEQFHTNADNYLRNLRGEFKFRILVIRVKVKNDEASSYTIFCIPISDILPLMRDGMTKKQMEIECGYHQTELGNSVTLRDLANRADLFKYAKDYEAAHKAAGFLYGLEYADLTGMESVYFPKTDCLVKRSQRVLNDFYVAVHEKTEREHRRSMVLYHTFYRKFVRKAVLKGQMKKLRVQLRPMTDSRLRQWFEKIKDQLTSFGKRELGLLPEINDCNEYQGFTLTLN